jgi:hypothetical protein
LRPADDRAGRNAGFALDVRTIYCGLKGVVEDGAKALKEKIRGMEELRDKALELRQKGLSPREIRRRLLGLEDKMYCITSGHFSKQNVIDSILGMG